MSQEVRIVIAQRGWVFVGFYSRNEHDVVLRHARSIRRWGTDKGLGQLAKGPRPATVLDEAGTVRLHPLQIIAAIDADTKAWSKHLGPAL